MKDLRILITAVGGGTVGESIILALQQSNLKLILYGANITPLTPYLYLLEKGFLVPKANLKEYIPKIIDICIKDSINAIIPGNEEELKIIAENEKVFLKNNIVPLINSPALIERCYDKFRQYEYLKRLGILCPKSALPKDKRDFIRTHGFPFLIKPQRGSGSRNVTLITNDRELREAENYFQKNNTKHFFQEFIPSDMGEYTIGVVLTQTGKIIDSIALKRIHEGISLKSRSKNKNTTFVISSGISQGLFVDDPKILDEAEKIAVKIKARGPLNIQARLTKEGLCVMEINPRFSGSTSMRAGIGFNCPELVIRDVFFHEKLHRVNYKRNVLALRVLRNIFIDNKNIEKITKYGYYEKNKKVKYSRKTK